LDGLYRFATEEARITSLRAEVAIGLGAFSGSMVMTGSVNAVADDGASLEDDTEELVGDLGEESSLTDFGGSIFSSAGGG